MFLSGTFSDWLVTVWPKGRWAKAALTRSSLEQDVGALRKGPFCHPKQIVHFCNHAWCSPGISLLGPGRYGLGQNMMIQSLEKHRQEWVTGWESWDPSSQSLCFRSKGVLGKSLSIFGLSFLSCNNEVGEHPSSMILSTPLRGEGLAEPRS